MNTIATVHIVDDDEGVRNSLRLMMESHSLTVRLYESGERFLEAGNPPQPACMVADMRLPGMSGIDLLQRLRESDNQIPTIIISGNTDVPAAIRSMKLGAIDVLQKPIEREKLLEAVNLAIKQSADLYQRIQAREVARKRLARLTPRERELLKLIVDGRSNKQIALDLNIAFRTVINHRSHLMAKTEAINAADLTRLSMIADTLERN